MRENEFERKVNEQMEEFRLRPSEMVWPKVEAELRSKKRRRVVFYICFLAGLGLIGYTGYDLLKSNSTNKTVTQTKSSSGNNTDASNPTTLQNENINQETKTDLSNDGNQINSESTTEPGKTNSTSISTETNVDANPNTSKANTSSNKPGNGLTQNPISMPGISNPTVQKAPGTDPNAAISKKTNISDPKLTNQKVEVAKSNVVTDVPVNSKEIVAMNGIAKTDPTVISNSAAAVDNTSPAKNESALQNETTVAAQPQNAVTDSSIQKANVDTVIAKTQTIVDSTATVPPIAKNRKHNKLNFGIELSYGASPSRNKLLGVNLGGAKSLDAGAMQAPGSIPNATPGGGSGSMPPSDAKSGSSYRIGFVAELPLTKKSSLVSGLRYTYASETIKVGSYQNSSNLFSNSYQSFSNYYVGRYYSSTNQQDYTNKYHFLELPLIYQLRLNKERKNAFLWNVGLTPAYMVSTNALVYDTTSGGIYYENPDAFKRFHINFQTGLAFRSGTSKKLQWSVGPDISLDMTRLMKEDIFTNKRYLMYFGVTGKLIFARQKK